MWRDFLLLGDGITKGNLIITRLRRRSRLSKTTRRKGKQPEQGATRVSCWAVCSSVWRPFFAAVAVALDVAEPFAAVDWTRNREARKKKEKIKLVSTWKEMLLCPSPTCCWAIKDPELCPPEDNWATPAPLTATFIGWVWVPSLFVTFPISCTPVVPLAFGICDTLISEHCFQMERETHRKCKHLLEDGKRDANWLPSATKATSGSCQTDVSHYAGSRDSRAAGSAGTSYGQREWQRDG